MAVLSGCRPRLRLASYGAASIIVISSSRR